MLPTIKKNATASNRNSCKGKLISNRPAKSIGRFRPTRLLAVLGCASLIALASIVNAAATVPALIPAPQKMELGDGIFRLSPDTPIFVDRASRKTGEFLAEHLRKATGYSFKVHTRLFHSAPVKGAILLTTKKADSTLGAEGYDETVTPDSVVIRAAAQAGVFYGAQTLLQLLPPQIFSPQPVTGVDWQIPSVHIEDQPRFKWRGFMLDVARHFYTKQEVERILDLMALYKLNRFHWHLVDDQGWRIEIKRYPELTKVGAWRDGIGFGLNPKDSTAYGPDGRYGGFYTQKDIREVVAYAAARHITIVPEIEMPGHSSAALRTYPQYSCTPDGGPDFRGIYDPSNPATFEFIDNILTEVFRLFPSKYIHIGGDEVNKETWKHSASCQALMKREGLKNEEELQSWFIRRIEKFVNQKGRTLIGWSEILQGGLAQNAVVMDWIGGGKEAASAGHDVVMTPTSHCYFDYYQSLDHSIEPRAIGGYISLHHVYSFEPIPAGLSPEQQPHILGAQANLWTEFIPSTNHLEYMIFPRLNALAEVAWSPKGARNWQDFLGRLAVDEQRLAERNVNFRRDTSLQLGNWTPSEIQATNSTLQFECTDKMQGPGEYHVILDYDHGNNGINVTRVALLEDGREVASDNHEGFAGGAPRKPVYILKLPALKSGAQYTLETVVSGSGGTDSYGAVSWVHLPGSTASDGVSATAR